MSFTRLVPLTALLALSGCIYHTHEHIDEVVCDLARQPYDPAPPGQPKCRKQGPTIRGSAHPPRKAKVRRSAQPMR